MKKCIISAVLAGTIGACMLSACGSSSASGSSTSSHPAEEAASLDTEKVAEDSPTDDYSGEEKTLTVFHYMGQTVKQEGLNNLEEEFRKTHPNIKFENIFYNQGTDYFPQLSTALASGEQPDIIMGNPAMYPDLIENGYAMDLTGTDFIKNINISKEDLNDASANGRVYSVPIDFKASGFFYNVKLFEQYNLSVPRTLDEFNNVIETFHDNGVDPIIDLYGEGSTGDIETRGIIVPRAVAAGDLDLYVNLMDGTKKLSDYPYFDEALTVWDGRMKYPRVDAMANNQDKALEEFVAGEGAMIFTGNWNIGEILAKSEGSDFEFDFFLPPIDNDDSARLCTTVDQTFMVNPNADCVNESLEFLQYWATDGALEWSETTMMPLITGETSDELLPVVKSMADLKANKSISQGVFTKPFDTEFTTAWREGLISYAESVCTGKPMTHDECLNSIQEKFDDIIATSK